MKATTKKLLSVGNRTVGTLVMPFFVIEGRRTRQPVVSMPGVFRYSADLLVPEVRKVRDAGVKAVILFGIPSEKDLTGSGACAADGVVQQAVRAIKKKVPDVLVVTDVCLCEYTSHGHCGILRPGRIDPRNFIDLRATLDALARTALSHAESGADIVAPSAMMHRQVAAIRRELNANGFSTVPVMGYSVKFASAFYGPFRDAADSAPKFGDRRSYQLDPADARRAVKEAEADVREGADIIMVKPALAFLDVLKTVHEKFSTPLAAYNVSGEYAMIKAAAANGWIDEKKVVMETITGIRRCGADIIISYHAKDIVRWARESA